MMNEKYIPPETIVQALRCSSTPSGDCIGEGCPFFVEEEVPEDMVREIGRVKWPSCDVDAIGMAGAKIIERLMHEIERRDRLLKTLGVTIREDK